MIIISLCIFFIIIGLVICSLGLAIYKFKKVEFISLYDATNKYDIDGLAKEAGRNIIYMGALSIIDSILFSFIYKINSIAIIPFIIIYCFILIFFSVKVYKAVERYRI